MLPTNTIHEQTLLFLLHLLLQNSNDDSFLPCLENDDNNYCPVNNTSTNNTTNNTYANNNIVFEKVEECKLQPSKLIEMKSSNHTSNKKHSMKTLNYNSTTTPKINSSYPPHVNTTPSNISKPNNVFFIVSTLESIKEEEELKKTLPKRPRGRPRKNSFESMNNSSSSNCVSSSSSSKRIKMD
ncbi:predicted protein [Naegleria gruberi]|uniref:Predicted protein n=1 Tax=Naegleria gruberi TaxID=5762 RepID=D2VVD2_NAEGR|nr:uncharacterized protein NAEGRDRAFT_72974 [Naegleria gruberi]EFC39289.1 predicted protein [Naegleria gruberi]|eukprot:XP_002672033.1 predicted protein [Naegleria gruberi strain NEG-M]